MDHLPIFCQLRDRDCLLVGGGDVAERKARLLLDAGARLTVNALDFVPQFQVWADSNMLTLVQGEFNPVLLDNCWLAIAATDNEAVNQQVSKSAEERRIFCNVVDAPQQASFIMPSIIDRSPLMVAVSSGGTSPVLARLLREKLESVLPLHLGQLAHYAGQLRSRVKKQFATVGERRRFWEKLFVNDRLAQSLANEDRQAVADATEQLLTEPLDHRGEVVLVGAGPGDAGLLTLKGLQQIQQADVVGLNQAPAIREKLIAHGMAADMPAAIVENGTAITQKVVTGTLEQLDILAKQMASPALIIVGRVVGLRDKLNWFSNH